jgi:hypothetical protein
MSATTTSVRPEPPAASGHTGRAVVAGAALGAIFLFLVFGGMVLAAGMSVSAAVGVGAFTAFWGGVGFGGMVGMVHSHTRNEGG